MQNEEVKLFLFLNRTKAYSQIYDSVLKEKEKRKLRDVAFELCEECRDSEIKDLILKLCNENEIVNYWSGDNQWTAQRKADIEDQWDDEWEDDYGMPMPAPIVKPAKIYPNDPCPCGSGKKYKKCCGRK